MGAGKCGLALAEYLSDKGVHIKGIIDNASSEIKSDTYRIVPFATVEDGSKIFISVVGYMANVDIEKQIFQTHIKTTVIHYADLYKEDMDV